MCFWFYKTVVKPVQKVQQSQSVVLQHCYMIPEYSHGSRSSLCSLSFEEALGVHLLHRYFFRLCKIVVRLIALIPWKMLFSSRMFCWMSLRQTSVLRSTIPTIALSCHSEKNGHAIHLVVFSLFWRTIKDTKKSHQFLKCKTVNKIIGLCIVLNSQWNTLNLFFWRVLPKIAKNTQRPVYLCSNSLYNAI